MYVFQGKSGIYVIKSKQYFHQFTSLDFHIFPGGFRLSPVGFLISPVENLLLGLTPEKFLKFGIFHGESSSPYRGTETGCITVLMRSVFYVNSLTPSITITKNTIFMHTQCACSTNNPIYMALFPSSSTNRGSQFLFININFCF